MNTCGMSWEAVFRDKIHLRPTNVDSRTEKVFNGNIGALNEGFYRIMYIDACIS